MRPKQPNKDSRKSSSDRSNRRLGPLQVGEAWDDDLELIEIVEVRDDDQQQDTTTKTKNLAVVVILALCSGLMMTAAGFAIRNNDRQILTELLKWSGNGLYGLLAWSTGFYFGKKTPRKEVFRKNGKAKSAIEGKGQNYSGP